MFFLMGLSQLKVGVAYVWFSECVGFQYKSTAFTLINIVDGMTIANVCLYYKYISVDWFWLCLVFCLLSYAATLTILICPESPRWLIVNGRSEEAIHALNTIAEMNGIEEEADKNDIRKSGRIPSDAKFIEDPTNYFEVAAVDSP